MKTIDDPVLNAALSSQESFLSFTGGSAGVLQRLVNNLAIAYVDIM